MALAVARRDASTPGGARPPSVLRPLLRFHGRLPPRALATVRRVLDEDDEFRARVADEVDEQTAERATWLFLARPDGWRDEFDLLTEAAADVAHGPSRSGPSTRRRGDWNTWRAPSSASGASRNERLPPPNRPGPTWTPRPPVAGTPNRPATMPTNGLPSWRPNVPVPCGSWPRPDSWRRTG